MLVKDAVSAARVDARWARDEARRLEAEAEKKAANDGWGAGSGGAADGGGGDGGDPASDEDEDYDEEDEDDEGEEEGEEEEGDGEGEEGGEGATGEEAGSGGAGARGDDDEAAVLVDAAPAEAPVDDEFEKMFLRTMTESIEQRKAAARVSGVTGDNMILPSSALPKSAAVAAGPVNGCVSVTCMRH